MKTKTVLGAIAGMAMLLSAGACGAAESTGGPPQELFEQQWIAVSTTAMAITGDVRMTPTTITFDNRVRFRLRYLSQATLAKPNLYAGWGPIVDFWLYEILDPRPEEILNGNRLYGSTDSNDPGSLARYLAVGTYRGEMTLLVFATSRPPAIGKERDYASFGYIADSPQPKKAKP